MDILVVGGGGREHAIIWALAKSPQAGRIYCAPGNAGIGTIAECVPIAVSEFDRLTDFALENNIDFVVIGPDDPLVDGIVDAFEAKDIPVFGPRKNAAEIEGSKTFMKDLLHKYDIPTAAYEKFDNYEDAKAYLLNQEVPIVIKADGLAAGKGVTVAFSMEQAESALHDIMVNKVFGDAGSHVVIEEFLAGQEMSILAFVDGETVRPMVAAQDHKQVFDNDQGPNTGGMGTYSPLPHIDSAIIEEAIEKIIKPTAKAMVAEGRHFTGILFAGLMISPDGTPKTIEFNARFGDPETQVVLPRLKSDLLAIMMAAVNGTLADIEIEWSDEAAVCVVLASGGYPASYPKGIVIDGLDEVKDALVFHAGTAKNENGEWITNGGRILGVVGLGADIAEARAKAYSEAAHIDFEGKHLRSDIAAKALV
ncbi:phosphoribosylamine--glycine ligase [Paenibacillus macquariensis]|uniref:Phosphoribosylamine--glycine ligase n=1 Tax=Paenibacillus macquariensis TaxID=948756 RepID=A0ABY1KEF0_9BACL|nr:phosphoribosylamine--glycine ligase [Paenibacillus macquariensis]MEC0094338.1 phosphoribosylamine--glycine ligase [Paenibacillus macquariensis]OAB26787.1 phosphoribosylamine--glycine ligase [Paenibacillus macquariensis subsp. macquariensis]SIR70838.1 phosphoribosylamine--glycine ligase [Paenibacillus macquariensis]